MYPRSEQSRTTSRPARARSPIQPPVRVGKAARRSEPGRGRSLQVHLCSQSGRRSERSSDSAASFYKYKRATHHRRTNLRPQQKLFEQVQITDRVSRECAEWRPYVLLRRLRCRTNIPLQAPSPPGTTPPLPLSAPQASTMPVPLRIPSQMQVAPSGTYCFVTSLIASCATRPPRRAEVCGSVECGVARVLRRTFEERNGISAGRSPCRIEIGRAREEEGQTHTSLHAFANVLLNASSSTPTLARSSSPFQPAISASAILVNSSASFSRSTSVLGASGDAAPGKRA